MIHLKNLVVAVLCFFCFCSFNKPTDWGKTGHRSTAQIANSYLKKHAKGEIEKLLNGKSMALVSTYGDEIKSDPGMRKYSKWHYIDMSAGKTYEEVKASLGPNIISALKLCVKKLKNDATPTEKKRFYLKMLIHLMGDLHQPLHIGRPKDKGGNAIKLKWFGEKTNLHKVWDENMIDFYKMSYTELALNQKKLTDLQVKKMQEGGFVDWMKDTRKITEKVYASAQAGDNLYYGYMEKWFPTVRQQLQKGGVRLAKILNAIFA